MRPRDRMIRVSLKCLCSAELRYVIGLVSATEGVRAAMSRRHATRGVSR